jgi:nucleoside-diphosphate-sugar epimerase
MRSAYVSTRAAGLLAAERVTDEGLSLVTLLPPIIYGPDFPRARNRITDHIRRVLRAPFRVALGRQAAPRNLVFVEDVIAAIARADRAEAATGRHLVSGENVTQNDLEIEVRRAGGARMTPRIPIPRAAALVAGRVADRLFRFDETAGVTARMLTLLAPWCLHPYALPAFDDSVAPTATTFAQGIRRTVDALRTRDEVTTRHE